jgi:ABC-2 type transport system permease protein
MGQIWVIMRRELTAYFSTPLAYVFIVIFLALLAATTFYVGAFFDRNQADLRPFFSFHPWLYLFLIPAITMRMWAEERKTGTIEFLMTLPISTYAVVIGKFLAAWLFAGLALLLTFPMWITVEYLGDPDIGVIIASYIGSWLVAGGFLAIGGCLSALTRNQVIAYIVTATVCLLTLTSGLPVVLGAFQGWAPPLAVDAIASLSVLTHFESITRGLVDIRDLIFFASLIVLALVVNAAIVDLRKSA